MADTSIAVQPASPAPSAAPVQLELASIVNAAGQQVLLQVMSPADEQGRPIVFMSEATGQDILQALKELNAMFAVFSGQLSPSTRGFSQSN